jgi:hypothetical protein
MKVNRLINLNFNTTSEASTYININFPVREIHVKSACYSSGGAGGVGDQVYYSITSDLVNGEPMALLYGDTAFSSNQFCDVSFKPYKPETINGTYTFFLKARDGTAINAPNNDFVNMILEFNGEGEPEN